MSEKQDNVRNPCGNVDLKTIENHEEYIRAKGLNELFSLIVTEVLLYPGECQGKTNDTSVFIVAPLYLDLMCLIASSTLPDLRERFKTIIKNQIDRRSADPDSIDHSLQECRTMCSQAPWKPRASVRSDASNNDARPSTAPAASDGGYGGKGLKPPKTAPAELNRSESFLQLQSERDKLRRRYYEQVSVRFGRQRAMKRDRQSVMLCKRTCLGIIYCMVIHDQFYILFPPPTFLDPCGEPCIPRNPALSQSLIAGKCSKLSRLSSF